MRVNKQSFKLCTVKTKYYIYNNKPLFENRLFDAWGNLVKLTNGTGIVLTAFFITDRGYTGHEHLLNVGIIHMNGRLYDPLLHRFLSPDNYVQDPSNTQNFNRYGYVMNNPLTRIDPSGNFIFTILAAIFCPPLLPMAIGADIGWISGGARSLGMGQSFLAGALKGGIIGAIGGGLSMYGGGTFVTNVAWGAFQGAVVGGLDAAVWGGDVGKGMLWGAASGALFAGLTSENMKNFVNGEGFLNNENVFNNMMKAGADKQKILDYFGFQGKYTIDVAGDKNIETSGFGASTNTLTGEVRYSENAFISYDNLKMANFKESFHHNQWKKGTLSSQPSDLVPKAKWYPEETKGFIQAYKNQGLFSKYTGNISTALQYYQLNTLTLPISQHYTTKWWHLIYKIPRRW